MRKGCVALVITLIVLAGAGVLVYRNGLHPLLVLWIVKQSWHMTSDFQAEVKGELELFGFAISGTGRVRFKKPALYDLDFASGRIIAGNEALWVVVPAFKAAVRVTGEGMTPMQLLSSVVPAWESIDPSRLITHLSSSREDVKLLAPQVIDGQRCWVLEWPTKTGETLGGVLYVSQRTRMPVRFDEMDSGHRLVRTIKLTNFRRNTGLKPVDFDYQPMQGYSTFDYHYDPDNPAGLEDFLGSRGGGARDVMRKLRRELGLDLPLGGL